MSDFFSIVIIVFFVVSGVTAFVGLSKRQDGNIRIFAIGALTLGLFLGFSILWTALAIFLNHRIASDPVPYWGIEIGVLIASVLCGFVFARPSAQGVQSAYVTTIDQKWIKSPRRAFRTGFVIALVTPTGLMAILFTIFVIYGLCTGINLFR